MLFFYLPDADGLQCFNQGMYAYHFEALPLLIRPEFAGTMAFLKPIF
jgi:hypothetical protein